MSGELANSPMSEKNFRGKGAETAAALERIAECIDFKKGKGDYDGLLSVMLHHQYSEEILEVHLLLLLYSRYRS